jgi:prepilin-type processing-associated H-X9-DG protein
MRTKKAICGFALRDLLAIISVAALLAMVFPMWGQVFSKKRNEIVCLANGRQMMRAFALYAEEHGGLLPPNEDVLMQGHNWIATVASSLPSATNRVLLSDPKNNLLAPYVPDARIWKCPADPATVVARGRRVPTVRNISMNNAVGTSCNLFPASHSGAPLVATHGPWLDGNHTHVRGSKFRTFGRKADFVLPDQTFVFIDELAPSVNDGVFGQPGYSAANPTLSTIGWVDFPGVYHSGGAGITFADGHVEIHKWRTLEFPRTALPGPVVTPTQRPDWEWLATHTTQPLR